MFSPARLRSFVCLSVCVQDYSKRVHGFGSNVACRQMSGHGRTDYLLSPIRIIVRIQEPDFLILVGYLKKLWRGFDEI